VRRRIPELVLFILFFNIRIHHLALRCNTHVLWDLLWHWCWVQKVVVRWYLVKFGPSCELLALSSLGFRMCHLLFCPFISQFLLSFFGTQWLKIWWCIMQPCSSLPNSLVHPWHLSHHYIFMPRNYRIVTSHSKP
jgi:hypothetical protein